MEIKKEQYIAPEFTIVDFVVENGFAISGSPFNNMMRLFDMEDESSNQETWSEHSTWDSGGDGFF